MTPVLLTLFQRGAADGLNSVIPYGDSAYRQQRPRLALPDPGLPGSPRDLDGFFALHPQLDFFHQQFVAGSLAIVHACGVQHESRSHFTAQNLVERGVASRADPQEGWIGRHFGQNPGRGASSSPFQLLALSGQVPVMLRGGPEPLAIANLDEFTFEPSLVDLGYPETLQNLYRSGLPLAAPARIALDALQALSDAQPEQISIDNGAQYPLSDLGRSLQQAARLIKSSLPVEVISVESSQWDHHESLNTYLPLSLADLDAALQAFVTDLGATFNERVTVLVHTEFGRRVAENASQGVDHGTGGVAYLMGAGVNGGQVLADWPGLASQDLHQGEDLRITTELRTVFAEVLSKRLGNPDPRQALPGFTGPLEAGLLRAI